jgi:citrate synthase
MSDGTQRWVTTIGKAEYDKVTLRGYSLTEDLLGKVTFGQMTYLMMMGQMPTPGQTKMTEALLCVLAEHGVTAASIAARVTYANAPEALQGAIAAAILGAGSVHLGSATDCARMLEEALADQPADADLDKLAAATVDKFLAQKRIIPGLGHGTHRGGDPRADKLFEIAHETGVYGRACPLLERIGALASERLGRLLPINVTGAMGAISIDLGVPWQVAKGFAVVGRAMGALAHLTDEVRQPLGHRISAHVVGNFDYEDPPKS